MLVTGKNEVQEQRQKGIMSRGKENKRKKERKIKRNGDGQKKEEDKNRTEDKIWYEINKNQDLHEKKVNKSDKR